MCRQVKQFIPTCWVEEVVALSSSPRLLLTTEPPDRGIEDRCSIHPKVLSYYMKVDIKSCRDFMIAYHLYYCHLKIFIESSRTQPD